ncbi:MAG: B12-binding domain-containing radical SAM protein [Syntrophorhabdaceae bacterium]|nr:B12-binding domain-containing radical SAM protein [Syntrophorhabdaceae bacterium]
MKILFIYPNLYAQIGFNYGISYISGFLKAHNIETYLLNINEKLGYPIEHERIKRDVLSIKPDIIGFSVLTNQHKYAIEIASHIKRYYDAPILFGGIHPTMDPYGTMTDENIDYICIGEGEEALLELLKNGSPVSVKNMGYRANGNIVLEPLRPYIDINKLPFKDYTIFDFQQIIDAKDGWVGLMASRGCPFRCTYCLNHKIMGLYKEHGHLPKYYLRRHTVDQIIYEIEYILKHYKRIKMFIFDDDIFTFDKAWLKDFSEKYRDVTDIGFVCNAHARIFDEDTAHYLKNAGCRIVKFGLESGSDRIRKNVLNRHMTNKDIENAFDIAHRFGLHTSAFVMIGLPHEKKEDMLATIKLLAQIKPGRFRWSLFFPFIGTRAYDIAKKANQIDFKKINDLDNFTDNTCMDLGEEENLLVDKIKSQFCLFVNGYGNMDGEGKYLSLVKTVEDMDSKTWEKDKDKIKALADDLDREIAQKGLLHYTVRYNPFMGVRSDWEDDSLSS